MVSYLTILVLGKPPVGSLPVFSAQPSFSPETDNNLLESAERAKSP